MMYDIPNDLQPTILVIFGMTGDLSRRYLLPSLFQLYKNGLLHKKTQIVGVSRANTDVDEVLAKINLDESGVDKLALSEFRNKISMIKLDLENPDDYKALLEKLNAIETFNSTCMNRLYYLSIPPKAYLGVINNLGEAGLNKSCQHNQASTRLLVEKPFGYDLKSAKMLISEANKSFAEEQTFRIDHYMAKETVQDILAARFNDPAFENTWDNQHISSIEITAKQKIGIEGRAVFYEPLGALRDFIQSHLIQILGIITMNKPELLDSDHIHAEKQAALEQIAPIEPVQVPQLARRGQYIGYREEVGNPESTTETFAEINVCSRSQRWEGVPIKLQTGKGLNELKTEIHVTFKESESPGKPFVFDFLKKGHPNAYERVLVDAIRGDHTLFATSQEILASWRIVQPVLDSWSKNADDLQLYELGSTGPSE